MQAERKNNGKLQWTQIDFESMEDMVRVLEFGAEKYDRDNWKKGFPVRQLCDSLLRHMTAFLNGEDIDPESGLTHIGHIQCNAMFLAYNMKHHPEMDDRKKEDKGYVIPPGL